MEDINNRRIKMTKRKFSEKEIARFADKQYLPKKLRGKKVKITEAYMTVTERGFKNYYYEVKVIETGKKYRGVGNERLQKIPPRGSLIRIKPDKGWGGTRAIFKDVKGKHFVMLKYGKTVRTEQISKANFNKFKKERLKKK